LQELRKRIAAERSRLKQVRQALTAAIAQGATGDEAWVNFYLAIGDYMAAAMHRLHIQDVRMTDLLNTKADLTTSGAKLAMQELDERLSGNQLLLADYLAAVEGLRREGIVRLADYETAAKAYTDFIVNNMGHHAGSVDLARAAFSADDWESMAYVSEADTRQEEAMFNKVFSQVPANLSLEGSEQL